MDLGVKHHSFASSNASWKSGDGVSDQFPAGLRVLVVDDDPTCLRILEKMLKNCLYQVTTCNRAEIALSYLRDNRNGYDVVISDVHMPDMDGFKLLEYVGLEMDLPVIMMSADDSKNVVMMGVTHGACDYLIKPVRMEALKNIWQHVVRKKKHEWKERDFEQCGSVDDQQKLVEDLEYSSSANEGSWKNSKRRKDEEDEVEDRDDSSSLKKPRVVWSVELHQQFVTAVNHLGIDKAVPKKILELMNVPGLTRENVASHLQKYRLYLRRLSGVSQHQSGLGNSFMGPPDAVFGTMSSLDLQALAASGQIPAHSLATMQAGVLGRANSKSPLSLDQRNIFGYENQKQVSLLHGVPTSMDSKQLATLQQSGNSLLIQMVQPQSRPQILSRSHVSNSTSSVGQPISSQAIPNAVCGPSFSSQNDFSGNSYLLVSNAGTSKLQDEVNSADVKASRGFVPNYDVFEDLNQHRTQDWPQHLSQERFSCNQKSGQSRINNTTNISQQFSSSVSDIPMRIKAERLPEMGFQNSLFTQRFGQEDLMSAILKQHEGMGLVENEFGFDGYHYDNLPV
ncbi:hypothetical protein ACS0TY_027798 [Phlomoides rotata]